MKVNFLAYLIFFLLFINCYKQKESADQNQNSFEQKSTKIVPEKNKKIVGLVKKFGPEISPTYENAVCTELVIQVLEKIQKLDELDKTRIRIITNKNIQELLKIIPKYLKEFISH